MQIVSEPEEKSASQSKPGSLQRSWRKHKKYIIPARVRIDREQRLLREPRTTRRERKAGELLVNGEAR